MKQIDDETHGTQSCQAGTKYSNRLGTKLQNLAMRKPREGKLMFCSIYYPRPTKAS